MDGNRFAFAAGMRVLFCSIWLFIGYLDVTLHNVNKRSLPFFFRFLLMLPIKRSVVLELLHYIRQTLSHVFLEDLSVLQEARTLGIALELVDLVPGLLARVHIPDIEPSLTGLRGEYARLLGCHPSWRVGLALYGAVDVRGLREVVLWLGEVPWTRYFFMKISGELWRSGSGQLVDRSMRAVGLNPWRKTLSPGQVLSHQPIIPTHFSMRSPMMRRGQIPSVFYIALTQECLSRQVHIIHPTILSYLA